MGGQVFMERAKGGTAKEAFESAREEALHECGHSGYTGSIAEKREFVMIDPAEERHSTEHWVQSDYEDYAEALIDLQDPRVDDKWGPAGCMKIGEGEFLFFGWASC
jgi:hypothetical protein